MQTFQEYMTKELQDAGLTDEQVTSALGKLYANEKLGPKLNALVKTATEDYNAQLGRVKAAEYRAGELENWYKGAKPQYDTLQAEYNRVKAELDRAAANGLAPEFDPSKYMTKEDWGASVKEMGGRYASTIKSASRITARHVSAFHEEPDLDAIDKIAEEQHLPLERAYDEWVKPRMIEREAEARKKWEKDTREQIERDLKSQYKLPPGPAQIPEQSILYHRPDPDKLPKDIDADLMEHWEKSGAAT